MSLKEGGRASRALLVAGPTAGGKSAAAEAIAREIGGVVVNADAMQVYDGLRILTARPTAEDEARWLHRLYGHVPPQERYSVGRWLGDVAALLRREARPLVLVGGTGLYFKALTEGLSPVPSVPSGIVEALSAERSTPALHALLAKRDPAMAAQLRPSDRQRILRALGVLEATGRSLRDWQAGTGTPLVPADTPRVIIEPDRETLYARVDARFGRMLEQGALAEVEALLARRLDPALPVTKAIGVRELAAYLQGEATLEEAANQARTASRRYAKRQMTFARGQMRDWPRAASADAALSLLRT